jgi:hypothetical protein
MGFNVDRSEKALYEKYLWTERTQQHCHRKDSLTPESISTRPATGRLVPQPWVNFLSGKQSDG